jgi:hypothetical protein
MKDTHRTLMCRFLVKAISMDISQVILKHKYCVALVPSHVETQIVNEYKHARLLNIAYVWLENTILRVYVLKRVICHRLRGDALGRYW